VERKEEVKALSVN